MNDLFKCLILLFLKTLENLSLDFGWFPLKCRRKFSRYHCKHPQKWLKATIKIILSWEMGREISDKAVTSPGGPVTLGSVWLWLVKLNFSGSEYFRVPTSGENFDMLSISTDEIERGLELGDIYSLFQPKPFCEICLKAKKKKKIAEDFWMPSENGNN